MIPSSLPCVATADAAFGPRVSVACRAFDFTVYFENLFFACVPAALFLLCCPVSARLLWREPRRIKRSSGLICKLVFLLALWACSIGFLVERRLGSPTIRNNASLAADVLEVVAVAGAGGLSYMHHCHSIRPSTLLALFLSARSLLTIARVRTLWLIGRATSEAIFLTLGLVFTICSLVLESLGKEAALISTALKPATPEPFSGFWKQASFAWLAGTFHRGYSKVFSVADLPGLDPQLSSRDVGEKLQEAWARKENKSAKHALLRSCLHAYRTPFSSAVIPRLCLSGFTFCQPFLVNATVSWVGETDAPMDYGKALIGAFAIVYCGIAASNALYGYFTFRFTIRLRGGLISLIHRQTVRIRAVDLGGNTAITLMGTDVERITSSFRLIHEMWASLIEIGVAIYLLERQVGVACIVPALIVFVFVGATFKLSAASSTSQRAWVEKVEDRLRVTSFSLERIKEVKMLGLSEAISSMIQGLREAEIAASAVFRKLLIVRVVLSNAPTNLAPMATFVVYAIIALVRYDQSILAARAFTSISLISLVTTPVLTFIQALPAVIQCVGCFDRIQEYCHEAPGTQCTDSSDPRADGEKPIALVQGDGAIEEIKGHSFGWGRSAPAVLRNISLQIPRAAITLIVGPIGSGKSTLIGSILGETVALGCSYKEGSRSAVAYCGQEPWLRGQTIRRNWYGSVIFACGLEKDLAQLPQSDRTSVAGNGTTLSGGQKQRIALARAVYSRHKMVLLDDVFSGIDATTLDHIASHLFGPGGLLRKMHTTVVLATHSRFLLQYADNIVVLSHGSIVETGTFQNLKAGNAFVKNMETGLPTPSPIAVQYDKETVSPLSDTDDDDGPDEAESHHAQPGENLTRQQGDLSIYAYYASASGRTTVALCLVCALIWAVCGEFATVWLDLWTSANAEHPNSRIGMYLGVYIFLGIASVVFTISVSWYDHISPLQLLLNIVSASALKLHERVLSSTFRAPIHFFHRVDIGSITNRFSQDMDLIDMSLPIEVFNMITSTLKLTLVLGGCTCLVKLVILCIFAKYLSIVVPFAGAVVYFTQNFYLRTSRQLRFLDIEAKAPLYTHFLELVRGAATRCLSLLDVSQRPVYLLYCVQQCLGFFLDMLVTILAVILIATVAFFRDYIQSRGRLVKDWTNMETSIGAVSRVKGYTSTTDAEETANIVPSLPGGWPAAGRVELSGAVASYASRSEPVLKDISMSIRVGEKIAVCGPSGSGKTSLILALLGMVEVQEGTITIDGIDILEYSRAEVRRKLNVVTQDSFLIAGSVRFNIDPLQGVSDQKIVSALQSLGLWDRIEQDGGLDGIIKPNAWSQGQRELLCLARAMVPQGKLLILDEAMGRYVHFVTCHQKRGQCSPSLTYSSVDDETEDTMQAAIDSESTSHTVLAAMHRLPHIHCYDRVILLVNGAVVEFDSPTALLAKQSRFKELYESGKM
ncbi:P-loop containing nucleoside triphosphate hydrolase protein [Aspergillus lucknowensis]|uniref:P-loop containing nucleoside triphosphate hydrolase protein n=1 Tax=Aspergillus lucknowensis TaxID=176173 RepID=A0ABR4LS49_9EURO